MRNMKGLDAKRVRWSSASAFPFAYGTLAEIVSPSSEMMVPLIGWGVAVPSRDPGWEEGSGGNGSCDCVWLEARSMSPARGGSVRARFKGDGFSSVVASGADAADDGLARSGTPRPGKEIEDCTGWGTKPWAAMSEWIVSGGPEEPESMSDRVLLSGWIGGGVGETP